MSTISNIAMKVLPDRLFHSLRMLKKPDSYIPLDGVTYNQDGLVTMHNCDFMQDEDFQQAYRAGENLDSWFGSKLHWRVHTVLWAAKRAANMEGDFVECGVNKGGFSRCNESSSRQAFSLFKNVEKARLIYSARWRNL